MNIAAQRGFWSLRPTLTGPVLELGCWLAAALLAVTLAISPTAAVRAAAPALQAMGVPQSPDMLAYRQHCIDRVLASDLGMTEEYVVRQINRQCSTRRRTAAPPVGVTCAPAFVVRLDPVARRVAGCPAG
jgi:hypothetical protein